MLETKRKVPRNWIPEKLFSQIVRVLPIVCVDLLVYNRKNEILLLERRHEPAKGEWWFPGGRVHFGETRLEAARRKLREECGLEIHSIVETGTFDCLLPVRKHLSHGVTTVFTIVTDSEEVAVDAQTARFSWRSKAAWLRELANKGDEWFPTVILKHAHVLPR
jgi:ADP-ribose pyrophosphatase YjhB (NUDIX family)